MFKRHLSAKEEKEINDLFIKANKIAMDDVERAIKVAKVFLASKGIEMSQEDIESNIAMSDFQGDILNVVPLCKSPKI